MATNTYVALATQTLSSAVSSVTFSSIPQGYTDLVLVASGTCSAGSYFTLRFNSDTSTNYSNTEIVGDGTSATSSRNSNSNYMYIGAIRTTQTSIITHIQNYSNTTTYKTVLSRTNNAATETKAVVGLWRATPAAITTIDVGTGGANTFQTGSTFTVYGIADAGQVGTKAIGGDIYTDSTYVYHAFPMSGKFTPTQALTADVFLVAGGGGGGNSPASGAGGAGGVLAYSAQSLTSGTNYQVLVGGGGVGGSTDGAQGASGTNSQFGSLTAAVGGGGGGGYGVALTGGSGGGGGYFNGTNNGAGYPGAAGTSGQGNAGGQGWATSGNHASGGGGGAGGAGGNAAINGIAGAGGAGVNTYTGWGSLSDAFTATGYGVSGYIAGGGGGTGWTTGGTATAGGGNGWGGISGGSGSNGATYSGGGGGGSTYASGGKGGSGLVIVRYAR